VPVLPPLRLPMVTSFNCVFKDFKSFRHKKKGTLFIQSFAQVLDNYAKGKFDPGVLKDLKLTSTFIAFLCITILRTVILV